MNDSTLNALLDKAIMNNIPLDILETVYQRGLDMWTEETNKTSDQYAFDRVNSFISGGKARELDNDLLPEGFTDFNRSRVVKKHTQRERDMYHTSRTDQVIRQSFVKRNKTDNHFVDKAGHQLTDKYRRDTYTTNRPIDRDKKVHPLGRKRIIEATSYAEAKARIHDAHSQASKSVAGMNKDPEIKRIHMHRAQKHAHAAKVLEILGSRKSK